MMASSVSKYTSGTNVSLVIETPEPEAVASEADAPAEAPDEGATAAGGADDEAPKES